MTASLTVVAAGRTHIGLVRRRNEDFLFVGKVLFAVADGLGGHVAGDIASSTVIEALSHYDHAVAPDELPQALGHAVSTANEALRRKTDADEHLAGMGTTLVALLQSGSTFALANVGDSRAYLLRRSLAPPAELVQLTEDHTFEHLLGGAAIVPNLPERLVRFLDGRRDGRSPDITVWQGRAGDRLVLCSDGLSTYVPHDLVRSALNSAATPDEAADRLVGLGIDLGGHDNITVVVVDVVSSGGDSSTRAVASPTTSTTTTETS